MKQEDDGEKTLTNQIPLKMVDFQACHFQCSYYMSLGNHKKDTRKPTATSVNSKQVGYLAVANSDTNRQKNV